MAAGYEGNRALKDVSFDFPDEDEDDYEEFIQKFRGRLTLNFSDDIDNYIRVYVPNGEIVEEQNVDTDFYVIGSMVISVNRVKHSLFIETDGESFDLFAQCKNAAAYESVLQAMRDMGEDPAVVGERRWNALTQEVRAYNRRQAEQLVAREHTGTSGETGQPPALGPRPGTGETGGRKKRRRTRRNKKKTT